MVWIASRTEANPVSSQSVSEYKKALSLKDSWWNILSSYLENILTRSGRVVRTFLQLKFLGYVSAQKDTAPG